MKVIFILLAMLYVVSLFIAFLYCSAKAVIVATVFAVIYYILDVVKDKIKELE